VEALHASFDKIDQKVHGLMAKGATDSELAACLHKAWLEMFHMPVSGSAVKALIMHYRAVHSPSKRVTRKHKRSQRGGMAPLDYMTGPGLTSQLYGRFPVEMGTTPSVLNSFDIDRFSESSVARSCNTTGGHPAINQRGGKSRRQRGGAGLLDMFMTPSNITSTIMNGHPPQSVPINSVQSLTNAIQGGSPLGPPSTPVAGSVPLSVFTPKPYDATIVSNLSSLQSLYTQK